MVAAASLPLMRGYYYIGTGDSMTHLGWVRDILTTSFSPYGLFYPGLHTVSITFNQLLGFSPNRAIMLFVVCVILAFFVFVPLCVQAITGQDGAMLIGPVRLNAYSRPIRIRPSSVPASTLSICMPKAA